MLEQKDAHAILTHPIFEEIYPEVLELLRISRGPVFSDPKAIYDLQVKIILPRLKKIEQTLDRAKNINDDTYPYKYLSRIYKWIVDGIALRCLGFNPLAYRILSDNRSHGSIIKEGQQRELKEIISDGSFAVLNDLTNFVRIGDISIFRQKQYLKLLEVKKKKSKNSTQKTTPSLQEKRMLAAEQMINGNFTIIEGEKAYIEPINVQAKTYLNAIKGIMLKAGRDGIASRNIGPCVKVIIMDFAKSKELNLDFKKALEDQNFSSFPKDHDVLTFHSIDLAWAEHDEFARGVFPPTVLKLPTRLIADVICGKKLVTVSFDLTSFCSELKERGFEVRYDIQPSNMKINEIFTKRTMPLEKSGTRSGITVKKGPWYIELPSNIIPRILFEYLHPDTITNLVEYHFANRDLQKNGSIMPIFKNHSRLYR